MTCLSYAGLLPVGLFKTIFNYAATLATINCYQLALLDIKPAIRLYFPFMMVVGAKCFAFGAGFFLFELKYI